MAVDNRAEEELRQAVGAVCERFGAKGHLLIYLDSVDGKVKFAGNIALTALTPLLMAVIAKTLKP